MTILVGGGGGATLVLGASTSVPGVVLSDVAPSGPYPVALTADGYPAVMPTASGGFNIAPTGAAFGVAIVDANGTTAIWGDSIQIARTHDVNLPLKITLHAGSSGTELQMVDSTGATMWEVDADGSELLAAGLGRFGHAAPAAASAITGALSTVVDPAAKAVLTSVIAALIADGGATNGTT